MTEDRRDLRDPQKLGELLNQIKQYYLTGNKNFPLSVIAEEAEGSLVPNYDGGETLGRLAAREYRKELEGRDDIYAKSRLAGAEWDEPSID